MNSFALVPVAVCNTQFAVLRFNKAMESRMCQLLSAYTALPSLGLVELMQSSHVCLFSYCALTFTVTALGFRPGQILMVDRDRTTIRVKNTSVSHSSKLVQINGLNPSSTQPID
jgi:hypothetical protein